ncbi:MAG: hypothetical protein ACREO9_01645, partial [Lysobacterales bacterium]
FKTEYIILVTLDGVRIQEIFTGLDETIAVHDEQHEYSEMADKRQRFGGATEAARREALMPNFWLKFAPQGIVLGNVAHDNHVKVQNAVLCWQTCGTPFNHWISIATSPATGPRISSSVAGKSVDYIQKSLDQFHFYERHGPTRLTITTTINWKS